MSEPAMNIPLVQYTFPDCSKADKWTPTFYQFESGVVVPLTFIHLCKQSLPLSQ
jgi:hypothetical protein